jgi:hypothetical protein
MNSQVVRQLQLILFNSIIAEVTDPCTQFEFQIGTCNLPSPAQFIINKLPKEYFDPEVNVSKIIPVTGPGGL